MIELIVQVFQEVLRFAFGEFLVCHMRAAGQLLLQSIERLNRPVWARQDAGIVASRAIGVI
jgi:hypothetical protein